MRNLKGALCVLTLFFMISGGQISAQTNKGSFLIGELTTLNMQSQVKSSMNLGYSLFNAKSDNNNDSDPEKVISINLTPRMGYFVVDNLALGLDIPFSYSHRIDGSGNYKSTYTILSLGPFIRYYLPGTKVRPFMEFSGSLGRIFHTSEFDSNESKSSTSLKDFGGGVGAAIPLGKKVSFDLLAGYHYQVMTDNEYNEDNDSWRMGTLGLKLGFTVFL